MFSGAAMPSMGSGPHLFQKLKRHILSHRTCALGLCVFQEWNYVNFPTSSVSVNSVSGSRQSYIFTKDEAIKDAFRAHLGMFACCLSLQSGDKLKENRK